MKKILLALSAIAFLGTQAQTSWTLDKSHTKLGFGVSHLMISETEGSFKKYDASISSKSESDFTDASVKLNIDAASINTDDESRDNHLKGADFFDVAKFPSITFESTSFKKVEGNKYKVVGKLTMHGVTKEVTLDVTFAGSTVHPYNKKTVAGFKFSTTIKRTDFGIAPSTPSSAVGDEVAISGSMEFFKN